MNLLSEVDALSLVEVWKLTPSAQLDLLNIRNEPSVRKNMFTSHTIGAEEHARWISETETSKTARNFGVLHRGRLVGGIGLSAINNEHRRADLGYFLTIGLRGIVGCALEVKFLDYAFSTGEFDKLNGEIIAWNASTVKLNKRFGFTIEGVRREHVLRDGKRHDVVLIGMTKTEWTAARARLFNGVFSRAA